MDELNFFQSRRVFITGHSGFKGAWLTLWLLRHGAQITGFSLDVPSSPSLFETLGLAADIRHVRGDIRDADYLTSVLTAEEPEIVFHLAAQPLVLRGWQRPKETFDVNIGGTVNLMEVVRQTESVRAVICITSDKCYDRRGWAWGYRESDPLGGNDPYSASKAGAELVAAAYRESFLSASGVGLATGRAGNVIGGGDWAEDRLIPDCIRALVAEEPIPVRNPEAIRPWQHVLEPLAGYLLLAKRLWGQPEKYSGAWNFGPSPTDARPVAEVVKLIIRFWGRGSWQSGEHRSALLEAPSLRLSTDKAMSLLPWRPQWNLPSALKQTVDWYRDFYGHDDASKLRALTERQIDQYEARWIRWWDRHSCLSSPQADKSVCPTPLEENSLSDLAKERDFHASP
jgi:CDP-glucose 4,6-dehydratase